MSNCAIVGINWGDEGKGRMVDLISSDYDVVVRYQGQTVFKGRLNRTRSLMAATLRQRGDVRYMFSASYEFRKN